MESTSHEVLLVSSVPVTDDVTEVNFILMKPVTLFLVVIWLLLILMSTTMPRGLHRLRRWMCGGMHRTRLDFGSRKKYTLHCDVRFPKGQFLASAH